MYFVVVGLRVKQWVYRKVNMSLLHPAFDGVVLDLPLRCDEDPLKSDCQMNASLNSNSISFSVQSLVGSACKKIMTSWKSIFINLSDHLTRNATQT